MRNRAEAKARRASGTSVAVDGARGQFGNPEEAERTPLEAATRKRSDKCGTQTAGLSEVAESPVNLNPAHSHS
jgi:hypothetical protein